MPTIPTPSPAPVPAPIRGLTRLWQCRAPVSGDAAAGHSSHDLLARVLRARGLHQGDAAARFLEPSLKHLHDPCLIPQLDHAAQRIVAAARAHEPIVIYGDYDVDGITATAILYHTLKVLCPDAPVTSYVPHRLEEGYGLNEQAIREIAASGARLIISVDCGVTAVRPAQAALECNVDLIITDHHNPPQHAADLPPAYAVVHPRSPGSTYPFGELCGAGVAFKLAWRLATLACGSARVSEPVREVLLELLGLCSLGVIADVVPLIDENRVIAHFGLSRIKHSTIPGLRALVEASGLGGERVGEQDVGFKLAPRLNACGRMGHAREAVELLTTAQGDRAATIAEHLTRQNDQRRHTESLIFEQAVELATQRGMIADAHRAIVLAHPDWHPGVVGIVCSRLVEKFGRPTILLRDHEGLCHGSGRSIDRFNLHAGLEQCAAHLIQYGGHDMAAGMKLATTSLDAFTQAFTAVANAALTPSDLIPRAGFDTFATVNELSLDTVRALQRLAPFGRDNPAVRLALRNVRIEARPETFGNGNKHLSLRVSDGGDVPGRCRSLRLVGWNWASRVADLARGMFIDVLVEPCVSTFTGGVEATICDLRPAADSTGD